MSKGNPYVRAVQAAIKADPTLEIAPYTWCLREVEKLGDGPFKALHKEVGGRLLKAGEWKELLTARLIAAILPLARRVKGT